MSFYSQLRLKVLGLEDSEIAKVKAILEAAGVPEVSSCSDEVYGEGEIRLGGGHDEAAWSDKIARAIWAAIRRYVEIEADWWYERDPDETHSYNEDRFNEMVPALEQLALVADEEDE